MTWWQAFRKVIYCRAFANQERPGLPNNNAEKSYLRQPLCTQTNLTQLKGVNNGGAAPAEQEAEDAVWGAMEQDGFCLLFTIITIINIIFLKCSLNSRLFQFKV